MLYQTLRQQNGVQGEPQQREQEAGFHEGRKAGSGRRRERQRLGGQWGLPAQCRRAPRAHFEVAGVAGAGHRLLMAWTVSSTSTWPPSGPTRLLWMMAL